MEPRRAKAVLGTVVWPEPSPLTFFTYLPLLEKSQVCDGKCLIDAVLREPRPVCDVYEIDQSLRQLHGAQPRMIQTPSHLSRFERSILNFFVTMPEHYRAVSAHEIVKFVVIDIPVSTTPGTFSRT